MLKTLCRLSVLALCHTSLAFADSTDNDDIIVQPFTANYTVYYKSDPVGTGVRALAYLPDGNALYSYHTDSQWLFLSDIRSEKSTVKIEQGKVIPTHYLYEREGTGRDKAYEWRYDTKNNKATNLKKPQVVELDFSLGIQDKLSYHLQNRLNLIKNPQQKLFVYPVVSTSGSVKNYVYQHDGEEEITLPYGKIKTVRFKREVIEKKKVTYVWFAPELNYLLVKLSQEKEGKKQFEAQLKDVKISP
jgi:hypothetical protein